jgi:hypothetical protein
MPDGRRAAEDVARNFGPAPLRVGLIALALAYFSVLIADHLRVHGLRSVVPGPVLFFAQVADLFPEASGGIIEYRAEGWLCGQQRFAELEMGTLFPMLAGNKENRFYRLMHFYRQNRQVLGALDAYCVRRYPPVPTGAGPDRIGGVRFLSLILPLPKDPSEVVRYARKPLSEYPEARRRLWYHTPARVVAERCADAAPGNPGVTDPAGRGGYGPAGTGDGAQGRGEAGPAGIGDGGRGGSNPAENGDGISAGAPGRDGMGAVRGGASHDALRSVDGESSSGSAPDGKAGEP